jgi:hypothetical protein
MKNDPTLEKCLGGVGVALCWSVRGKPSQCAHTADHRTPPDLGGGGEGVAPLPLESPHLGSAIITEEKSTREIAVR